MPARILASLLAFVALISFVPPAQARDDEGGTKELASIATRLKDSFVIVEWTLQYDKGQSPGGNWSAWRMGRARPDSVASDRDTDTWEELVSEERPAEKSGILLSPTIVLTDDILLNPRFIKNVAVRIGDRTIPAKVCAIAGDQPGLFLELSQPASGGTPLKFIGKDASPAFAVSHAPRDSGWVLGVSGAPSRLNITSNARQYTPAGGTLLLVTKTGEPVGVSMSGEMPADGSWKGSPLDWRQFKIDEYDARLDHLSKSAGQSLARVALTFRSPRTKGEDRMYGRGRRGASAEEEEGTPMTEWNGTGIVLDSNTVIVLANLASKVTARLDKIRIVQQDGTSTNATFVGTLKDFGAFIAKPEHALSGAATVTPIPILDWRQHAMLVAEISVYGETRTAYYGHDRVAAYDMGLHRQVHPIVPPSREGGRRDGKSLNYLFDDEGRLAAIPIARRDRVASEERYDRGAPIMTPISYIRAAIDAGKTGLEPENKPVSEDDENRLAWLGVEMQALDPELARANGVSDQTSGGQTGALISYLYPNSPAAKAGLQVGDILLRLNIEGQPKPLEVELEPGMEGMFQQFWAMLDRVPEQYFDQLPKPWGSAENAVTRALTEVGSGTPFTVEFVRDGKLMSKALVVEQGPAYYESAKRFKSDAAGLTIREITYEVRRYFQLKDTDPGVIISKIERGGKAAVAGLKPYEIVTSVNDTPINAVADFENAIKSGGELRLSVKRMTEGRIVKLKLAAKGEALKKESAPDESPDAKPTPDEK